MFTISAVSDNLKVVWAQFSTLGWAVLLDNNVNAWHAKSLY